MREPSYEISGKLDYIVPNVEDWPIHQVSKHQDELIEEVISQTIIGLKDQIHTHEDLLNQLQKVLYAEKIRLTRKPWRADRKDEPMFWSDIKSRVLRAQQNIKSDKDFKLEEDPILRSILRRYCGEIVGTFKPGMWDFAESVIPSFLRRLHNAAANNPIASLLSSKKALNEKVRITGNIDKIRELAKTHTIICVPTHFSNLDSMVIGWSLSEIGLPAFTYGAGLNLFGIKLFAYFMNRLGAYKVDRRKKNLLYLETLKEYSRQVIYRNVNSLFFPGGTRSRSGEIETNLKLGLLGTAIDVQKKHIIDAGDEKPKKILVLPAVFSYHFVLEAKGLVNDYLKSKGKEKFLTENDDFSTSYKILRFMFHFLRTGSEMIISFGELSDVFGNYVDDKGRSLNQKGQEIFIKDYFIRNGEISNDKQRAFEYTKMLGDSIVKRFYETHVVLSSSVVAYVAFRMVAEQHQNLDFYTMLRLPKDEIHIDETVFKNKLKVTVDKLLNLKELNKVKLTKQIGGDLEELIKHGLTNIGISHAAKPLTKNGNSGYTSENLRLLFFYHNKLQNYGLDE